MPYVSVPKDLTAIKNKVLGPLTKRQLICFSIAGVLGLPTFYLCQKFLGNELAMLAMMAVMIPCFLFATFQRHNQPLEILLKNHMESCYVRNTDRPYETENGYAAIKKQMECEAEIEKIIKTAERKQMLQARKPKAGSRKQGQPVVGKNAPLNPSDGREGKKNAIPISPNQKLDRKTIKKIEDAVNKAKKNGKIPQSAQQTLPYKQMYEDGICEIGNQYYSKTIQFFDINYELENNDSKNEIFEKWCDFLNYFDQTVHFQFSFLNLEVNREEMERYIFIEHQDDEYNDVRQEFTEMLKKKMRSGNNGILRMKYITYSVSAKSYKDCKLRIEKITADILNNFKKISVPAQPMNGYERLHSMYRMFHQGEEDRFLFNWDAIWKTGLSTKDFICPSSFSFKQSPLLDSSHYFRTGNRIGAVNHISILAPELEDRLLADLLGQDSNMVLNIHVDTLEQQKAIKWVKTQLSNVQKMKIEEQKKAVKGGYDMDILPPDLKTYEEECINLLRDLQKKNERMFILNLTTVQTAKRKKELDSNMGQIAGICLQYNCELIRLDDRQEQGYMSALPLGVNFVEIKRSLTTSSTAIFIPFTTVELFQTGEVQYYGVNALSGNLIMVNRKRLRTPNGLILGTPGGGKSFAAKREILNVFLTTTDDIIISDPEAEYGRLVKHLKGQTIKLSLTSKDHINPMDINMSYSDEDTESEEDPVTLKADFILSLMELIAGGKNGLEPDEIGMIDRCIHKIYEKWVLNPIQENVPILEDLYNEIRKQRTAKADRIADGLELYVHGSLNVFNHKTNVDMANRIINFDIKDLGKQLKKIGMMVVQDQVWNRVTENRGKKYTRFYDDEFHLKFKDRQTAEYSVEIWKRFRKFGGIPTGITQNVKDFFKSPEIETILDNSDFIYMLSQAHDDAMILAETLNISEEQLKYVENAPEGEGLLFYSNIIIPFRDRFPKDTIAYQLMTTKPDEQKDQGA